MRASCQTEDDRAGCDAAGHAALKRTLNKRGNAERAHVHRDQSPPGGRRKSRTAIRCQAEPEAALWRAACILTRLKSSRVQRSRAKRRRESPNNVIGRAEFFVSEIAVVGPISSLRESSSRRRGPPRFRARSRYASASSDADGKPATRRAEACLTESSVSTYIRGSARRRSCSVKAHLDRPRSTDAIDKCTYAHRPTGCLSLFTREGN